MLPAEFLGTFECLGTVDDEDTLEIFVFGRAWDSICGSIPYCQNWGVEKKETGGVVGATYWEDWGRGDRWVE